MSTTPDQWIDSLSFSNAYQHVYCALGIHPWYVDRVHENDLVELELLLNSESVCALGEIGLDFGSSYKANRGLQLHFFEKQLQLACYFNKPVSIHVVKAHNEMMTVLSEYSVQGVIHGLGSSLQIAQRYVDLGFKIGVNGVCVRSNARRYHEMIKHFGLEYLVLETDFPNVMLPGLVKSDLVDIVAVANQLASLLNVPVNTVLQATSGSAEAVFKF